MTESEQLEYPRTVRAAVSALVALLDEDQKAIIAASAKEDLLDLHFSLGEYIRNTFGLWGANQELLEDCAKERAKQQCGSDSPSPAIHPDDASVFLLENLWRRLHC